MAPFVHFRGRPTVGKSARKPTRKPTRISARKEADRDIGADIGGEVARKAGAEEAPRRRQAAAVRLGASALRQLHPALLPLLVTITLPSAWSALTIVRRRYESFHTWVQHARAGHLISSLLTEPAAAPEIRVHGVGPFLLRHFRSMSETAEAEQARLARLSTRTGLIAAVWTGLGVYAELYSLQAEQFTSTVPAPKGS